MINICLPHISRATAEDFINVDIQEQILSHLREKRGDLMVLTHNSSYIPDLIVS